MVFSSAIFLFFFAIVFFVQWYVVTELTPKKHRLFILHVVLLVFSYIFYMSWDWRFGFLMATTTTLDYVLGRLFEKYDSKDRVRRVLLVFSIITNLGILGYFKYVDFFIGSFVDFVNSIVPGTYDDYERKSLLLNVILPLGISFFTFQSMSYTIDVYRRVIPAEKSFLRFALFVSFFPQLVAGPIVTAKEFLPQLTTLPTFDVERLRNSIRWFALGFLKKAVIADNMAPIVDPIFANPGLYDPSALWLGTVAFAIQVYCDFSGYSDMAWGAALALGYQLPENFRMPYLSKTVSEHWQRWHMSLIRWIRDYLYIPLGGSRVSYWRHKRNIFLTMFLSGLWHGANWTFLVWGAIHGVALAVESGIKEYRAKRAERLGLEKKERTFLSRVFIYCLGVTYTLMFGFYFNVIFRVTSISDAWTMLTRMLGIGEGGLGITPAMYRPVGYCTLLMIFGHAMGYYIFEKKGWKWKIPLWLELALVPVAILVFTQIQASGVNAFIYFVF